MDLSDLQRQWVNRFNAWATSREDVRAAFIVGSRGRSEPYPPEEWSDLDVAFITTRPRLYVRDVAWMHDIGDLWTGLVDPGETFGGLVSASGWSVYQGGVIVDFFVFPNTRTRWVMRLVGLLVRYPGLWHRLPDPLTGLGEGLALFFRRGVRVLLDKDGLVESLGRVARAVPLVPVAPPSREEFQRNVDGFWIDPPRVVAYLRRGALAGALKSYEPVVKQLLKLVEWNARAKSGWKDDGVWYRLKWLERWADPQVLEALPQTYARYDADEMWRALFATMALYCWLVAETAMLLGYDYVSDVDTQVTAWIERCFAERDGPCPTP